MRVVIVGNGIAGIEAATALRRREEDAEIVLVSEESDHFFSRTALMYVLVGQLRYADIEPQERDLYARLRLSRVRARAVGLDLSGRRLLLAGGLAPLPYDRLLIACGSRPRPGPWPGVGLLGVGHFVTLQDLAWLEEELYLGPGRGGGPPRPDAHLAPGTEDSPYRRRPSAAKARGRKAETAVVIGGGLVGIEVVECMLAAGLRPHFVLREEHFWPMSIDAREGAWIAERLAAHGVQVHLGAEVEALRDDGQGRVRAVRTAGGQELDADCVVVAIGVVPNTGWLQASGLAMAPGGGLRVGTDLACSAPGVWAAGDCAAVPWADGEQRPEQLWYTARDQGRVAAGAMLGDPSSYRRGTWYNSAKLMDLEYTTVGRVDLPESWSWRFEEQGAVRSSTRVVCQGQRVVGFNLLGRRWDHTVLRRFIEEGRELRWVLAHLSLARFDTELVPPLRIPPEAVAHRPDPEH